MRRYVFVCLVLFGCFVFVLAEGSTYGYDSTGKTADDSGKPSGEPEVLMEIDGKEIVGDIVISDEFKQLEGFGQVGFAVGSEDVGGVAKSLMSFSSFGARSSEPLSVRGIYEEVDTGFFNVDEKAVKQTYVVVNNEDVDRNVTLNVLYEIDSDFVLWNGSEYFLGEVRVCFEAFEMEVSPWDDPAGPEIFPEVNDTFWIGHTIYFGNNYYDFRDVLELDYGVCVYSFEGKSYIDLEVRGFVEGLGEWVVDPVIGWTEHVISNTANRVFSVHAADVDSDGDMDVLSANYNYDEVMWYENDGEENFVAHSVPLPVGQMQGIVSVYPIDLDLDGDMDILSTSVHGNKVAWHENDGEENFTFHYIDTSVRGAWSVYALDVDSDGDIDVLSVGQYDNRVMWYENDGEENFVAHVVSTFASGGMSVYALDVDSDGDIDVLSANLNDNSVRWYENDGEENFVAHVISSSADGAWSVYALDVDSDGDIDVLSASQDDNKIAWYENDGEENFVAHVISSSADGARSVFAKDLDGDEDIDVLSANYKDDEIVWYENDGEENFVAHVISSSADVAISVFAEDLDDDGDIDVLSASMFDHTVAWYEADFLVKDTCSGELNVFVEDSEGNMMSGLYSYLGEDILVTGADGFVRYEINGTCDAVQNVEIRCSDGVRICGNKSSIISYDGDVDTMSFVCDVCRSGRDVFVRGDELRFGEDGVEVFVHSVGVDEEVEVSLFKSCGGVKELVGKERVFVSAGEVGKVHFLEDFDDCEKIDVSVGVLDGEDYFENNFIRDFFVIEPLRVYFEVETGNSYVDSVVEDFLGEHVEVVGKGEAEVEIYVGKKLYLSGDVNSDYLEKGLIRFEGEREGLPWNGVVDMDGSRIFVFGNEVDGTVAGVKRLVEERGKYLNGRSFSYSMGDLYLSGRDLGAVEVFDYLRSEENVGVYGRESSEFGDVVDRVLRGWIFNLDVSRVLTSNDKTSLRIKHIRGEMSEGFRDVVDSVGRPVVMAGGLFSSLTMWEGGGDGLAFDLAGEGKDVWEIEITGGPGTECDGCADYSYEDLVDSYWPALVGAVQYYSGAVSVDYVGHSNGCRVALSALSKYQDSGLVDVGEVDGVLVDLEGSSVVGTFVGVGCPGAFEGESILIDNAKDHPNSFEELREDENWHPTLEDIAYKLSFWAGVYLSGDNSISLNLWRDYNNFIQDGVDFQPGNFNVDRSKIFFGFGGVASRYGDEQDDGVVTVIDIKAIANEITSTNSDIWKGYRVSHSGLPDNNQIKEDIRSFLKNGN